jgi:hypothetical protein
MSMSHHGTTLFQLVILRCISIFARRKNPRTGAEPQHAAALRNTSCANLGCLVALDADTILAQVATPANSGFWFPIIDGASLTQLPADAIKAGKCNRKVPVLLGSNRNEDAMSNSVALPPGITKREFVQILSGFGVSSSDITAFTRLHDSSSCPHPRDLGQHSHWWWALMRIGAGSVPRLGPCGVRWLAKLLSKGGTPGVHTCLFAHPTQAVLGASSGVGVLW